MVKKYDESLKKEIVKRMSTKLEKISSWTSGEIEKEVESEREKIGWSKGDLYMTLRMAVSGSSATPPLFQTMEVMGKEKTIARLKNP